MADEKALAVRADTTDLAYDPYTPTTFERAMVVAENIAKSRLFGIATKEAAFVILATGHELGLSPMQSLRGIFIIEGRPSPSADATVAIILRSGLAKYFREVSTTDTESTWETLRIGNETQRSYTYTIKDAEAAGLVKPNGNWMKYRRRMLAARAKAFLGRDVYPDLLLGLVTQEELEPATPSGSRSRGRVVEPTVPDAQYEEATTEAAPAVCDVDLTAAFATCESLTATDVVAGELKDQVPREQLLAAYKARRGELKAAAKQEVAT